MVSRLTVPWRPLKYANVDPRTSALSLPIRCTLTTPSPTLTLTRSSMKARAARTPILTSPRASPWKARRPSERPTRTCSCSSRLRPARRRGLVKSCSRISRQAVLPRPRLSHAQSRLSRRVWEQHRHLIWKKGLCKCGVFL